MEICLDSALRNTAYELDECDNNIEEKTVLVARIVSQDATCRINSEDYNILGFGAVLSGRNLSKFQKRPSSSWYEFQYSSAVKM